MKRANFYLFVVLCVAMLSSCAKDENTVCTACINDGAKFLSLDYLTHQGGLKVLSDKPWSVTNDASWLTISQSSGPIGESQIDISLQENSGPARFTTLNFLLGDKRVNFVVSQSAKNVGFDGTTHLFYLTFGTMPTLYAGLYMLHNEKPSYFFFERANTFSTSELPTYVTNVQHYGTKFVEMREYMKATIRRINQEDPTAVFGLYVDDLRSRLAYDCFVAQGIDSSRVKTTLLSDGTATYNLFYDYFNSDPLAQSNWDNFANSIEAKDWDHSGLYPSSRASGEFDSFEQTYYLITRPNYQLVMQYRDLLQTTSPFIKEKMKLMKINQIAPYELLSPLSEQKQAQFYKMANFDREHFLGLFNASPKPNLIIIGTSGSDKAQKSFTKKIYDDYNATYDIFFKPHPADLSSGSYETDFAGLKLLPGKMPFEIFVWSLLDKIDMIGGFPSTVYLTVPLNKVHFIFAPDAQSLARPLNLLFADAPDVEWIQ